MDYANDWQLRRELIWCAMTATNSQTVKDPIAYVNRKQKKFGDMLKEAVSTAYEFKDQFCYAVEEDKIDEKLCAAHGWKTIQEFRKCP